MVPVALKFFIKILYEFNSDIKTLSIAFQSNSGNFDVKISNATV